MFSGIQFHFCVKASSLALVPSDPTVIPGWLGGLLCSGFSWAHLLQEVTHSAGCSPQSNTISHTARTAPTPSHLRSQAPPPFPSDLSKIRHTPAPVTALVKFPDGKALGNVSWSLQQWVWIRTFHDGVTTEDKLPSYFPCTGPPRLRRITWFPLTQGKAYLGPSWGEKEGFSSPL